MDAVQTALWAPSDSARRVSYRESWGLLAGMLFLLAFVSKPGSAALLFQPVDDGFVRRHAQILDKQQSDSPQLKLPGKSVVQRITRAVSEVRPDLLH